ncbi:hypothetical protein CN575_21800 [Bacillus wiedmannii]|uniref:hypothetical protein n=1 Tax=Bacillus cereus group TaxID=86661 RepID=UPI000BF8457B|nr:MULTISPECIES: hypothetical protein [Bacillus cereus group]MCH5477010.1 hypothetical protein [Bacillus cereus]PEP31721.1 hypothetical protein CN575_21800 [Bacillus wiedmannii]
MPEQDRDTHAFEVIKPKQNEDFTTSPFFFSYERSGATLSGEPGLTGTVRFTLKKKRDLHQSNLSNLPFPFLMKMMDSLKNKCFALRLKK